MGESAASLFERVMGKVPRTHPAYIDARSSLTYGELDEQSRRLACWLEERLDGAQRVALYVPNGSASVVGYLGVLRSRHVLIGVDADLGRSHNRPIVDLARPQAVITSRSLRPRLSEVGFGEELPIYLIDEPPQVNDRSPGGPGSPDDPAWICFTSGSTGAPSGVVRTHRQTVSTAVHKRREYSLGATDRVSHLASFSLAFSNIAVGGGILNGATLCRFPLAGVTSQRLAEEIERFGVTFLVIPAAVVRAIGSDLRPGRLSSVRQVISGGESLSRSEIAAMLSVLRDGARVAVQLASTEADTYATLNVSAQTLSSIAPASPDSDRLPSGRVPQGRQVHIVDEAGRAVSEGTAGEIMVVDEALALGYFDDPALSARKFTIDPGGSGRPAFLTGDIGRFRPDGMLEFLGRADTMVKIRGYRVQLERVERALLAVRGVAEAAAAAPAHRSRGRRVVAYVVSEKAAVLSEEALREALRERLSPFEIPSRIVQLATLPRLPSGKLDRRALPEVSRLRPPLATAYCAPRDQIEEALCAEWARELEVDRVGIHDDLYKLGGDSLTAAYLIWHAEKTIGVRLPSSAFSAPTVAGLVRSAPDATPVADQAVVGEPTRGWVSGGRSTSRLKSLWRTARLIRGIGRRIGAIDSRLSHPRLFGRGLEGIARHLSFETGLRFLWWYSSLAFVRRAQFSAGRAVFARFCDEVNATDVRIRFRQSVAGSLLQTVRSRSIPIQPFGVVRPAGSGGRFWRSAYRYFSTAPLGELRERFGMQGGEHLDAAYQRGRGVLLLSYHGMANWIVPELARRVLGCEPIMTASGFAETRLNDGAGRSSHSARLTLLVRAVRDVLSHGQVVHALPEPIAEVADGYELVWAGRRRSVRAGFAELVMQTGAAAIPALAWVEQGCRIRVRFWPALIDPGASHPDSLRRERLISGYERFLDECWRAAPQTIRLASISAHLASPEARSSAQ